MAHSQQPGYHRWRLAVVAAAASTVVFVTGVSLHPGGAQHWTGFDDVGQALTPFIATATCTWTAWRSPPRERVSWLLIAGGCFSWAVGQVIWTVDEIALGRTPVSPSVCDAGFLLSPLLIVCGILLFVDTPAGFLSRARGAFEGALIGAGLLTAVWTVLLAPVVATSHDPVAEQVVTLAYPVLDAVVLSALLFLATRPRTHRYGQMAVLAGGIVALAVADSSFWYLTTVRNYGSVNPTDAGWFAGFLLIALSAPARRRPRPGHDGPQAEEGRVFQRGRLAVALPELVAMVGLAVAALDKLISKAGNFDRPSAWTVVVLAALALGQGMWVVVEHHSLTLTLEERVSRRTEEVAAGRRHFEALVKHSSDIVVEIGPDLVVRYVSDGMANLYGWASEALVGGRVEDPVNLLHPLLEGVARSGAQAGRVERVEWDLVDGSGRSRRAESKIANLVDDPDVGGYVVNTRDVTDQTELERELRHQAFHDQLTGLANRELFNDRANHALLSAARRGTRVGVMLIDLDGFKDINDSLGHHAGDNLLRAVATQIVRASRATDTVARLGGDEFVVLMEDLDGPNAALAAAERMRASLRDASKAEGVNTTVTTSAGVAISDESVSSVSDLLRDADTAMYVAKNSGKDGVRLFEGWMRDQAQARFRIQSELADALARDELVIYYQPSYHLASGRLEGFEALVRWDRPGGDQLSPLQFIPIAEESGFIVPLGRWVLRQATRQLAAWSELTGVALTMAINVSARQVRDPGLIGDVRDAIVSAGLAPERVVLEITESVLVHDAIEVAQVLAALKEIGVRIAVDDFGTGYSSLSYIQTLPIDILKVDRAFVAPLGEEGTDSHKLVVAILNIAHALGLSTVAEGVEFPRQAEILTAVGCDTAQGFLWSPPVTAARAAELVGADAPAQARPLVPSLG